MSAAGRVVVVDGGCTLFDAACWTDEMSACVREQFPDVSIACRQSDTSLSRFCVCMTLLLLVDSEQQQQQNVAKKRQREHLWGALVLAAGLCAAAVMFYLCSQERGGEEAPSHKKVQL